MKKLLFLPMLLFLGVRESIAQLENIKVRKAFESKTDADNKPAIISLTIPKEKESYYTINAGIGYDIPTRIRYSQKGNAIKNTFTGFYVFNKNTQIDKKQHNYKIGISDNSVFELNLSNASAIFGTHALQYLRDIVDSTNSLVLTTYWSPFYKKTGEFHLSGYPLNNHRFNYFIYPTVGLEYQKILETKAKNENTKGGAFRSYFSLQGNLMVKKAQNGVAKQFWPKAAELIVTYTGRQAFQNTMKAYGDYIPLFKMELNFYPANTSDFSIGLSYNSGTNPLDGLQKQTYWLFTIQYQK